MNWALRVRQMSNRSQWLNKQKPLMAKPTQNP